MTTPLYSIFRYTGTGAPQALPVPPYLDKSHIQAFVNGSPVVPLTWLNASTVQVTAPAGQPVVIQRRTSPGERLVDYQGAVPLTEADLDLDSLQAFYLAQEAGDTLTDLTGLATGPLETALGAAAAANASAQQAAASAAILPGAGGSGLVGFSQASSYPLGSLGLAVQGFVNVKSAPYNAVGDGVADDTAAMQAAHATGLPVYYPKGAYKFTRLTGVTAGGIIGAGQTQTVLISSDTSAFDLIPFTGASVGGPANGLVFRDFMVFVAPGQKTSGAALALRPASGEHTYASFHNVTTAYTPIGVDFVAASLFNITGCNFLAYTLAGVKVANTWSTDAGDSNISGSVFSTPYATGTCAGVLQRSSGGLRVVNNKFLGGCFSYLLSQGITAGAGLANAPTSNLVLAGNSCELYTLAGVFFEQTSTASFVNVAITGNQFGVMQGVNTVGIATDGNPAWLSTMAITGNVFNMMTLGAIYCIGLTNVSDVSISGNVFKFNGGTLPRAVVLSNCTNVKVGPNTYGGLTNSPFLVTGGSRISIHQETQSGTVTVPSAGSSAYGPLTIFPAVAVAFPSPFLGVLTSKDIDVGIAATSGEVSASVVSVTTSGDTTTGFTVLAISVNTNAATVKWAARGVV